MTEHSSTETRRYKFEQIRNRELARGASEDEATRIATDTVDRVVSHDDHGDHDHSDHHGTEH